MVLIELLPQPHHSLSSVTLYLLPLFFTVKLYLTDLLCSHFNLDFAGFLIKKNHAQLQPQFQKSWDAV